MKSKNELLEHGYDGGFAAYCDHTVLRAYTKPEVIDEFCKEAIQYGAAAVCVCPLHVARAHKCLEKTGVKTATVIGFPLGATKTCVKVFEAVEAVKDGADEVDMVIDIGSLRAGDTQTVYNDIKAVVDAVKGKAEVKVIIETCYLTDEEKVKACELCIAAGADFVKTSTGTGTDGATVHDVELLVKTAAGRIKVKASGNVADRASAYAMIKAGADRLGVSRVPQIVSDDTSVISASKKNQPPKFN